MNAAFYMAKFNSIITRYIAANTLIEKGEKRERRTNDVSKTELHSSYQKQLRSKIQTMFRSVQILSNQTEYTKLIQSVQHSLSSNNEKGIIKYRVE